MKLICFVVISIPFFVLADIKEKISDEDTDFTNEAAHHGFSLLNYDKPARKINHFMTGNFAVVASYGIRRGKPYNIAVTSFKVRRTTKFTFQISGTTEDGVNVKWKKFAKITREKPRVLVQFSTRNIVPGIYELCVSTDTGYSEKKDLVFIPNKYSFMIETDQPIYFSQDVIRFRVLAIDSETKLINPKQQTDIYIKDQMGSIVANYIDVRFLKGRFQGELELPFGPVFGSWEIYVESSEDTSTRTFEVAELKIPPIYATLKIPKTVPIIQRKLTVLVDVKYSFRDNVAGKATVIFERYGTEYFRKQIDVQKSPASFDLDLVQDLKAGVTVNFDYNVSLAYFDEITGTTVTESKTITVVFELYKIILTGDEYIRPGETFSYSVVVQKYDESPAPAGTKVEIYISPLETTQTLELNSNGFASSSFEVSVDDIFVSLEASTDGATSVSINAELPVPNLYVIDENIQEIVVSEVAPQMMLNVLTKRPIINSPVQLEVILSEKIDKIFCIISAKSVLLESKEVPITIVEGQDIQSAIFSFQPTFYYGPMTNVIAFYVRSNGRILTASTTVNLWDRLVNYLSFSADNPEYYPNENINVQINTLLNSFVSLVAIDQRLLTLSDSSSITKPEILEDLKKYYATQIMEDNGKIPDYVHNFNDQGLLLYTNIPAPDECYVPKSPTSINTETDPEVPLIDHRVIQYYEKYAQSILWNSVPVKTSVLDDITHKHGQAIVSQLAPFSIASFVVHGISMNAFDGIGFQTNFPEFKIFRPFFISAEFPFSIKRTEVLIQSITVYNFLKQPQTFEVKVKKDPKFVIDSASSTGWTDSGEYYTRTLTTEVNVHWRFQFALKGIEVGVVSIQISAIGPLAGDTVEKILRIEPIAVYKVNTDSALITIEHTATALKTLHCNYPTTKVGSADVSIGITGDIMGRQITNLPTGLINLPQGCGEQTLLFLAPDVFAYNYLIRTNQLDPELLKRLVGYIAHGYANELRFLRSDGAFSAWGNNHPGSTWLTAYAGWIFYLSKDIIKIDMNVIRVGLAYLATRQSPDGSFFETSTIYHREMQGGSANGIAMTAFITNYLSQAVAEFPEYKPMYDNAVKFLENNWWSRTDNYALAIIGYALKSANSLKADNVMNFFYMRRTETLTEISYENVETTAYTLLMLLARGEKYQDAVKIARYLVRLSNSFGGYFYSQDTVIGLLALSKFGAENPCKGSNVHLSIAPNIGDQIHRNLNWGTTLGLETIPLDKNVDHVAITATSLSSGCAFVNLKCGYYQESSDSEPAFSISYQYTFTCGNKIILQLSIRFVPIGSSGMTTATIDLPSGFVYSRYIESPAVRRDEPLNNNEAVNMYFDAITNNPVVVMVEAIKSKHVVDVNGGRIRVVENFNPANEAFLTFVLPENTETCGIVSRR